MTKDKFSYIKKLIQELSRNEKYALPAFLLQAQLVEYALKYLLGSHPNRTDKLASIDFIKTATMGRVIGKLEELDDANLEELIEVSKKFLQVRNRATHHFLTSETDAESINQILKEESETAESIESEVRYILNFIEEQHYDIYRQLGIL